MALVCAVAGCSGASAADAGIDAPGRVRGPDGQWGICCPRDDNPDCDCPQIGGWAPSFDRCNLAICDAYSFVDDVDEWGCPIWSEEWPQTGCCLCVVDAAPPDAVWPDAAVLDAATP